MFKDREIVPGMFVRYDHDSGDGPIYCVKGERQSTEGHGPTQKLGEKVVDYTQHGQDSFPPGTEWSTSEAYFRQNFTPITITNFI